MRKALEERAASERLAKTSEYTKNMEELISAAKRTGIGADELRDAFKGLVPEGSSLDQLVNSNRALAVVTAGMANAAGQIEAHRKAKEEADRFREQAVQGKGAMERSQIFEKMLGSVAAPSGGGLGFPSRFEEPAPAAAAAAVSSANSQASQPQVGSDDLLSQPRKRSRTETMDSVFQATYRQVLGGDAMQMVTNPRLLMTAAKPQTQPQ